ncbi:calcium-binding protein [Inquilinus sp. Marseille-Q2685]|uniref:calcium-binding protein n=1 Tax=Inquilinus sp. Marseille-Q2685 TaxID=2866581 RepID=UPI001CE3DA85|nr:calcium-binding protein [Inquilinus sp. Marseille-Q2685]
MENIPSIAGIIVIGDEYERDVLYGDFDSDDELYGLGGDDWLAGDTGADLLDGGDGIDTAFYLNEEGVEVDLATGINHGAEAEGDVLVGIENLSGSYWGGDILRGDAGANLLDGSGGDDQLFGRDGDDTLEGDRNNDLLQGGAGADRLDGGNGIDTAAYDGEAGVVVDLGAGTGRGGEAEGDTLTGIENLLGTGQEDLLIGSATGNDLSGRAGDDVLLGEGGNDTLAGGGGRDTLLGGDGGDRLLGGSGQDVLSGGAGSDAFVYTDPNDARPAPVPDIITDFSRDEDDHIDLSAIDADIGAAGDQAFAFIGAGAFTGVAGQLRCQAVGPGIQVEGDIDGDGDADVAILCLSPGPAPEAGDFVL